jgi:hypothetical protein
MSKRLEKEITKMETYECVVCGKPLSNPIIRNSRGALLCKKEGCAKRYAVFQRVIKVKVEETKITKRTKTKRYSLNYSRILQPKTI